MSALVRETSRYVAAAAAYYLSATAFHCPCGVIYECHALPAGLALLALSTVTLYGIFRSKFPAAAPPPH